MTHRWKKVTPYAEARLESDSSRPDGFVQAVVRRGAKIYRCTGASEPDLGALRIILGGRSVVPGVQQEPINKGSQLGQKAVRPVEPISKEGEVGELLRELEEQKWRAQQEAVCSRIALLSCSLRRRVYVKSWTKRKEGHEKRQTASGSASLNCSPSSKRTDTHLVRPLLHITFDTSLPILELYSWDRLLTWPYSVPTPRQIFTQIRQSARRRTSRTGVRTMGAKLSGG